MKSFFGKSVFLTGAASGIGYALAVELARAGCRLFLVDRDAEGLERLTSEVGSQCESFWTHVCDLQDSDSVSNAVRRAVKVTAGIDLLINNAGVAFYGPTDSMTQGQWDWLMRINLLAPIQITHELLPGMLERPDTHIVNMCSISGLVAGGRFSAYHTSKFGLIGFTESLRAEYGRRGVGVTAICPGPVRTRLYTSAVSGRSDRSVPEPPGWLCTTPEHIAKVTLRSIRRNRRQVLITPMAHGLFQLKRFFPGVIDFINQFSRQKKKRQRDLAAAFQRQSAEASSGGSTAACPIEQCGPGAEPSRVRRAA